MASLPQRIKSHSQTLNLTLTSLRPFSSSSPPYPHSNPNSEPTDNVPSPPQSPRSTFFSDIKDRLRSPQPPPRRIPDDPPPPPPPFTSTPTPPNSVDEIRKHLAAFRHRSPSFSNPNPNPNPNPPGYRPISFQQLAQNNAFRSTGPQPPNSGPKGGGSISHASIRESLREFPSARDPPRFSLRPGSATPSLTRNRDNLPPSIFGREMKEKMEEKSGEGEEQKKQLKMYTYDELGEKLKKLRPEKAEKGGKDWFSLEELNVRLQKLMELDEEESKSKKTGVLMDDLKKSLQKLVDKESAANMQRISILTNIGLGVTPSFMLRPPQEHLLENVCSEWVL